MTATNMLPDWMAPDQHVQVEFGGATRQRGRHLIKAVVVAVDAPNNSVRVIISERDPVAKQFSLGGQEIFVEFHRIHPGNDADRLIPLTNQKKHLLPPRHPRFGHTSSGTVEAAFSYLRRQLSSTSDGIDSCDESGESDAESLMSWNSISTSVYGSIAVGLSRLPSVETIGRRASFSASIALLHNQLVMPWADWNDDDEDSDDPDDGNLCYSSRDEFSEDEDEDEGDEDLSLMKPQESMRSESIKTLAAHNVGDHVSALLKDGWYDGIVAEKIDGGKNYCVRLDDPPKLCKAERHFWASHVRKLGE